MAVVNDKYFDDLVARIDAVDQPAQLQALVDQTVPSFQAQKDQITAQIDKLAPFLALATIPAANPAAIVTWITDFVTASVAPQVEAHANQVAQLAQTSAQIGRVTTALENAKERLGSDITIPIIT